MTAVLLIDEDCGICVAAGGWVARRSAVVVRGNASPEAAMHLRDLPAPARSRAVHHLDASGRRTSGGAAVAAALRDLPRWRWLGRALAAAPAVTESGYRLVARHRARISRAVGLDACRTRGSGAPAPVDAVTPRVGT